MKRLLLCLGAALAATAALFLLLDRPGRHWYDVLVLEPYFLGTWVSGNAHQPNTAVVWLSTFAMLFAGIWLGATLWKTVARSRPR